jgi:hypothetical protein
VLTGTPPGGMNVTWNQRELHLLSSTTQHHDDFIAGRTDGEANPFYNKLSCLPPPSNILISVTNGFIYLTMLSIIFVIIIIIIIIIIFILTNLKLLIIFVHNSNVMCYVVLSYHVLVNLSLALFVCLFVYFFCINVFFLQCMRIIGL